MLAIQLTQETKDWHVRRKVKGPTWAAIFLIELSSTLSCSHFPSKRADKFQGSIAQLWIRRRECNGSVPRRRSIRIHEPLEESEALLA